MKKVLVLAAALALFATPAMAAGIFNTKHNLGTSGPAGRNANYVSSNVDEICVFCHTPHGAQSLDNAPLWNRDLSGITIVAADLYNSLTLQADTRPSAVVSNVTTSDAPLCLSCHDGASMDNALTNPPNFTSDGGAIDYPTNITAGSATLLFDGSNRLTNDHPIGMVYDDIAGTGAGQDPELNSAATITGTGGLTLYGGVMWCSSCHDVHDNTAAPFLAKDNGGSALCTTCHIK